MIPFVSYVIWWLHWETAISAVMKKKEKTSNSLGVSKLLTASVFFSFYKMTNQLTSLQTVSKIVHVQVCFEPLLGHRQHPPGGRVLFGSGAGQHAAQGSPGRHPHIGDQAALPGRGPAPLQRPHVPPHVRHQPAKTQTEAARWGRPAANHNALGSEALNVPNTSPPNRCQCRWLNRGRPGVHDSGKPGGRQENCAGVRQRRGTAGG